MKTSRILQLSKRFLADSGFICCAVRNTDAFGVEQRDIGRVRSMVQDRLGVHYTLEEWLRANHGITKDNMHGDQWNKKMMKTRRAWVNSMIAEFRARGD